MAGSSGSLYTAFIDIGLKGLDKVDKYMKDAVSSVQNHMGRIGEIFTQSDGAIKSFVGAANPLAMNTFGASVELLKARIGQSFTPYILQASKAIQDLGNWIKNIDPETKKSIANWVMYGTAAAGAFYALSKGLDVMKMLAANPLALVLLGIGAAAIKASQDMDKMTQSMDAAIERGERMKKGVFTQKEFTGSTADAIANDGSMTTEQKIAKAREMKAKMEAESHQIASNNRNDTFGKQAATTFQWAKGQLGFEDSTQTDAKKMEKLNNEIGLLTDTIDKLSANKPIQFTDEANIPKKGKGGDNRLLLGAMGGSQGGGGSMSLDSAYGRLNAGALGQNDLQREMMKIQQETLLETRETAKDTSSITDILKKAVGL